MKKRKPQYLLIMSIYLLGALLGAIGGYTYGIENKVITIEQGYIIPAYRDVSYEILEGNSVILKNISVIAEVTGLSMRPSLFTGYTVLGINVSKNDLREGDIVMYEIDNNNTVLHRIDALYNDYLLVKGDNIKYGERINYTQVRYVAVGQLFTRPT